jgi:putative transposase
VPSPTRPWLAVAYHRHLFARHSELQTSWFTVLRIRHVDCCLDSVTLPRRIEPGLTFLVTRRTQRRTHLFRPDQQMNELFLYLLAVISSRHGVLVHGVTLMSTHEHLVVTDVRGCLPRFLAELHRTVALCVKVLRKWEGEVWDGGKTSVVELRTTAAVIEKLAYIAANPVAAGLVRRPTEWPGITTLPNDLGQATWTARRPTVYIDEANPSWPQSATLKLSPLLRPGMTEQQARNAVATELNRLESEAHASVQANGWVVVGARQLQRLSPFKRAKSWEPLRALNPTFAVGRGQKRAFFAAAKVLREFRSAYRDALDAWRCGIRNSAFPRATWLMRVVHRVAISPA